MCSIIFIPFSKFTSFLMKIYDVVIVGAGPVGLATAIGLYKRGITNILVIDRTRAFRKVGQGLDLLPNGLKALKYIDFESYEAVLQAGLNFREKNDNNGKQTEWVTRNLKGEKCQSFALQYDDWFKIYGEGRKSITWYDLQTTLRNQLPSDLVVANRRCVNISEEDDYVQIDCLCNAKIEANPFAHWQESNTKYDNNIPEEITRSLQAKLVIAADGINSIIRQILYKDSTYSTLTKPEYSGYLAIGCSGIEIPENIAEALEKKFLQGNPVVSISNNQISKDYQSDERSRIILFHRENTFSYLVHLALPWQELKEISGQALINLTLEQLEKENFPFCLKQLVSNSTADSMIKRPYYIHRATISDSISFPSTAQINTKNTTEAITPTWNKGRVVLVGDAAHGMPPFAAQGANQGLEDAATISTLIAHLAKNNNWDNTEAITQAFLKYEKLRRPMMVNVQQVTLKYSTFFSDEEREKYNREVYSRNLEETMFSLV